MTTAPQPYTCPKCGERIYGLDAYLAHTVKHLRKATDVLAPETKQLIDENINPEYRESAYKYAADKQRRKEARKRYP